MRIAYEKILSLGVDLGLLSAGKVPNRTMDGPYASWATKDEFCWYTIPISGTLNQGQPVVIDITQLGPNANPAQAEFCLPNSNANSSQLCFGCYQGASIVNPSGAVVKKVLIQVRQSGYGIVYAGAVTAGVAVTVGGQLVLDATHDYAVQATAAQALGPVVGIALATGGVTAKGGTIISVPGSGATITTVNAFIQTTSGA